MLPPCPRVTRESGLSPSLLPATAPYQPPQPLTMLLEGTFSVCDGPLANLIVGRRQMLDGRLGSGVTHRSKSMRSVVHVHLLVQIL